MSDYSIFPKALDGYAQLPLFVDNITPVNAEGLNRIRSAIVNIEATLGILPQGDSSTVSVRLDLIEANIDSIEADIAIIEASLSTLESRVTIIEDSIYDLPNSLFLNEAPTPTPQTNKGSIFVSDGSDGLVQNNLYYSSESGVVTDLLSGGSSNLQDAYDGGNVIVTSGGADIDFEISAAGGGFSVDGDGSVDFGGTKEVASFGAYSQGSLTLQSRDESLVWMQANSALDKTLTINGTNAGAGEGSVQIQAGDEIRLLPGTSFAPGSASKVKLPDYAFLSFGSPEIGIAYAPFYNSLVVGFPPAALAGGGSISVSPATTPESIFIQSVSRDTNAAGVGSNTGDLSLQTGNTVSTSGNTAGNSGAITVKTGGAAASGGAATAGGESGPITIETGQSGFDRTGYIYLRTGETSASSNDVTGQIEIGTGILNGTGSTSGNINLYTGSSTTNSGNIVLTTGAASGTRGYIAFLSSVMNFNNGAQSVNFYAGASDPNGVTSSSSGSLLFDTSGVLWVSQGGTSWKALANREDVWPTNTGTDTSAAPKGYEQALVSSGNIILTPGANGAILSAVPDGTATGGNARGDRAVDLQFSRTAATQVAGGNASVIVGGSRNTASAPGSVVVGGGDNTASQTSTFIGGGEFNVASAYASSIVGGRVNEASANYSAVGGGRENSSTAQFSMVPGGYSGIADHYGELAHASGSFSTSGDAQYSRMILRMSSFNGATYEMTLDGNAPSSTSRFLIANFTIYKFRIDLAAADTATGDVAWWEISGCIKKGASAANTALVGSLYVTTDADAGAATWTATATADTTNGSLKIEVTGQVGKTIRWVTTVHSTKVSL